MNWIYGFPVRLMAEQVMPKQLHGKKINWIYWISSGFPVGTVNCMDWMCVYKTHHPYSAVQGRVESW